MEIKIKKMSKKIFFPVIIILLLIIPSVFADDKIDVKAYFSYLKDDNTWTQWMVCIKENEDNLTDLELKINQPCRSKIIINSRYEGTLGFYITEPGITKAYNISKGKNHDSLISYLIINRDREQDIYNPQDFNINNPNEPVEYIWFFYPNENWTNGHAPISLFYQFDFPTKNSPYSGEIVGSYLGFANPYISNEYWQGIKTDELIKTTSQTFNTPYLNMILLFLLIISYSLIRKKNI